MIETEMVETLERQTVEEIASKFLGRKVEGKSQYDPSFLVAVPRQDNRTYLGLSEENYPKGFDTWYGYEFTALTDLGLPLNRVIKIVYPSHSKYIVESKSLKLYLNTFAMTKLGGTFRDVLNKARAIIEQDLGNLLKTNVNVSFIDEMSVRKKIFGSYTDLYLLVDTSKLKISVYNEDKNLLSIRREYTEKHTRRSVFHSLKSNCRVTHQPDFGDIFIKYTSKKRINEESLVKYLCSFRNEFHFHEEIVECCFTRLQEILDPEDELIVTALYTRRGGIDINPCRYQNVESFNSDIEALRATEVFSRYQYNLKQ